MTSDARMVIIHINEDECERRKEAPFLVFLSALVDRKGYWQTVLAIKIMTTIFLVIL